MRFNEFSAGALELLQEHIENTYTETPIDDHPDLLRWLKTWGVDILGEIDEGEETHTVVHEIIPYDKLLKLKRLYDVDDI